jgi:hypothetical protein
MENPVVRCRRRVLLSACVSNELRQTSSVGELASLSNTDLETMRIRSQWFQRAGACASAEAGTASPSRTEGRRPKRTDETKATLLPQGLASEPCGYKTRP